MPSLNDLNFDGARVLVRVDFNVPLVRLKMMNFLQAAPFVQSSNSSAAKLLSDYAANQNATAGVLGLIKNLTINHNLADDAGTLELKPGGYSIKIKGIEIWTNTFL